MDAISEHRETTRLGSYEILRKLTRGGMAEIFLARTSGPSGFEKLVVLKKILTKFAGKPRYVQLFLDEARLAASLDHPNIAQVYDLGMVDGSYFFAMEYLHGQDVRSILHRAWRIGARFPIEHAVQIARNVASALHFAHDKRRGDGTLLGLVHRDVSPSNIIVTYDGATKLLDFGVAKTAASTVRTRTGALKGKIAYMSPEQARGAPVDRRSDIFSLGIVLWEMVTTQRLYRAENDLATLQMIINQAPRAPSQVCPDCPPELERIVLKALAPGATQRYATAEQLVIELDEFAREHKLKQSPNALAAGLGELFATEIAAWRDAQASGVPLADHLHQIGDMTTPVSESDFIELPDPIDDGAGAELDDVADEPDDDADEDLTEHAAPIIDVTSPLAGEPVLGEPRTLADAAADLPTTTSTTLTAPAGP
ncbi:MAG TPA: serine/threonine-protein kinase, partial [Kofleriaceae bacterium]